jgi:aromatic-L-amino-acid decarboxylase
MMIALDARRDAVADREAGGTPSRLDIADPDPADLSGVRAALDRLGPGLEAFVDWRRRTPSPAYIAGQVTSEPGDLPGEGAGLDAVMDELEQAVAHGCRISAPGFWGYITTGATTAPAAAQAAVAIAGGQRHLLHAFNALEVTGLRWLAQLCGVPAVATGVFTSGGSTANLVALGAARQRAFERRGVDVAADGLLHVPPVRVYASSQAHRTIHRAAAVLGLGRESVAVVPTDGGGRIGVGALDAMLAADRRAGVVPVAVVGIAGTTDTGVVDPLADLAAVARRHDTWFHVDGAYGLVAMASPRLAPRFDGMAEADSWIVDPHKWLATGVGVGATYVRDGALLARAFMEGEAPYLEGTFGDGDASPQSQFDSLGGPWADLGVELSAPPRGPMVWSVLREIGRRGVAERVERHVAFASHLASRVRAEARLELLAEPDLSIVCFRHRFGADVDRRNAALLERLRRDTPYAPSSTIVDGQFAIRACFINPRTRLADVDGLVEAVLELGASSTGSG